MKYDTNYDQTSRGSPHKIYFTDCAAAHNSVPPDPTMSVDIVTQILNKIPADKWKEVIGRTVGGLDIPEPLLEEIQKRYSTDTEKNHACADYYVNCHPQAEWIHLTNLLYINRQFDALKEKKSIGNLIHTGVSLCDLV